MPLAVRGMPPDRTIVIPASASPSQRYAAEELRDFTEKTTGVRLPIATDAKPLPAKAILLGETKWTTELIGGGFETSRKGIGADGFRLVARPPHLLVVGSQDRGTLYGVYELLERFAGCRWYASWHSVIPTLERFAVPETLDDTQVPAFAMRIPWWYDVRQNAAFAARLRVGRSKEDDEDVKYGGNPFRFGAGLPSCHTLGPLLPPDRYYDEHPEYFSLVDGGRRKELSQPCLTNPDVLRLVTSNVLALIRKDPGAKFYGISQNDWLNYCECPSCKAVDDEEESHAGTMVRFVNAIAAAVEKEFPNAIIETLAYQYTRKVPKKTRLRHNVMPCLCTIECDFTRPIDQSPYAENIAFRKDIAEWSRQTDSLYLWDYTTDFGHYMLPFPNVYALQGNIRFFRANGVKYLFEQGAYQGRHADFAELKAWLLAKWMWNPDLPMEPLLDDFFAGYYGKAAPFVRDWFEAVHRLQMMRSRDPAHPLKVFDDVADSAIPDGFLDLGVDCWRRAIDAVKDDPATSYNVRMGAFSFDYLRMERMRQDVDKILCLANDREFMRELPVAKALAQSLLDRVAEAKDIMLAENIDRHKNILCEWRELAARSSDTMPVVESGEVEERHISLLNRGWWGDYVNDPRAADGRALMLKGLHFEWCSQFPMHRIAFAPGTKYRLRARIRVEKLHDGGEAFWAGVYDPAAKCGRATIAPRTENTSPQYAWYDIATWTPRTSEHFWIGPGRFGKDGKSAIKALWIDKLEFSRVVDDGETGKCKEKKQ